MPARKPTNWKMLHGTLRKDRLMNEPKPVPLAPKCPAWLPKEGKKKWRELAPKLEKLGLLTELDGEKFATLCLHWSIMFEAAEDIKKRGLLIPSARQDGALVKNPSVQIMRDNSASFERYASHFGLDPVSRARVDLPAPPDDDDSITQFMSGPQFDAMRARKASAKEEEHR